MMKLINTRCAICNSELDYTILYRDNFNDSDFNTNIFSARTLPVCTHYRIVRCKKCNLIRSNPIVDQSILYDLYRKSKFNYDDQIENLTASYLNTLKRVLHRLPQEAKILEIGCGNGFMLEALYTMGYENVFGIEPSIEAVQKADRRIQKKIVADILRSNTFKPNTFDFIFFFQTLGHIPDPNAFLSICYDLLVPNGFILALDHDVEGLFVRLVKNKHPIINLAHVYFYSKETIKKIFEKNNFLPIEIYTPIDTLSFRYLIWLIPMPKLIKLKLLTVGSGIFQTLMGKKIKLKLGNLCIVATKPFTN